MFEKLQEWLAYRLLKAEVKYALHTGRDDYGLRQFYCFRFVRQSEGLQYLDLYRRYPNCVVCRVGQWIVVLT